LGLFGQAGENHGNRVAVVAIAVAGHNDPVAMNLAGIAARLQGDGHFRPDRDGRGGTEFHPTLADANIAGRQVQAGLSGL